jgi:hypothetical protein
MATPLWLQNSIGGSRRLCDFGLDGSLVREHPWSVARTDFIRLVCHAASLLHAVTLLQAPPTSVTVTAAHERAVKASKAQWKTL